MTSLISNPKQLSALSVFLILISVGLALTGQIVASSPVEVETLDRELEPVIIKGSDVIFLNGAPVEHLFVYTYTGTGFGGQIPIQVDEVTASGNMG